jgi:hypothetical protein
MITRTDALHDALERLRGYGYVDGVGFACHGTMGAEALSSLGYDDLVATWVEAYKSRHQPIEAPPPTQRVGGDEVSWRSALGDFIRDQRVRASATPLHRPPSDPAQGVP